MEQWGIETYFAIASTAAEHTPDMQERLFIWPNFVDQEVYHDYRQYKTIPVLFTGSKTGMYPWRQRIFERVARRYPSLVCPHSGYAPGASKAQIVVGEAYARMLNASWFVPACGTVAKELVRKHLEIPACNACLVAERTPVLEAAGFVDMANCVFADVRDVVEKLDVLFRDQGRLSALIAAGRDLVQSRHTIKHRNQVFQWYQLHQRLMPTQQIVQLGPFEPLTIVERASGVGTRHLRAAGYHLTLLREGEERLWQGDLDAAERSFLKCLNFISYMPEPQLRLAICNLLKGKPQAALSWIGKPLQFTLLHYRAVDPDPVEWSYYLIALLCNGEEREAAKQANEFPFLHHKELDWARSVVSACVKGTDIVLPTPDSAAKRITIHSLPDLSFQQWLDHVCMMLQACGRSAMADKLKRRVVVVQAVQSARAINPREAVGATEVRRLGQQQQRTADRVINRFKRDEAANRRKLVLKQKIRDVLHRVEAQCGYFLPFRFSAARSDELLTKIQQLLRDEDLATAVLVGANARNHSTDALLTGASESRSNPTVFLVTPFRCRGKVAYKNVNWYPITCGDQSEVASDVKESLQRIRSAKAIANFDVFILDGTAVGNADLPMDILLEEIRRARFVFLIGLERYDLHTTYTSLQENEDFILLQQNPSVWGGYAFFERIERVDHESVCAATSSLTRWL